MILSSLTRSKQSVPLIRINAFRAKFACLLMLCAWYISFHPTLKQLASNIALSNLEKHSYFALGAFFIALFKQGKKIFGLMPVSAFSGFILVGCCCAFWLVAMLSELNFIAQFAVLAMLPCLFFISFGYEINRQLFLPYIFLFLLLPIGQWVIPVLQTTYAWVLVHLLSILDIAVFWQGNAIQTNYQQFSVNEIVNSIYYVLALFTLSILVSHYFCKQLFTRSLAILGITFLPYLASVLLITGCITIEHLLGQITFNQFKLSIMDWLGFGLGFVALLTTIWLLPRPNDLYDQDHRLNWRGSTIYEKKYLGITALFTTAILLCMPFGIEKMALRGNFSQEANIQFPQLIAWYGPYQAPKETWEPKFPNALVTDFREYRQQDKAVLLHVAYLGNKLQVLGTANTQNQLYNPLHWQLVHRKNFQPLLNLPIQQTVNEVLVQQHGMHRLIWQWYVVHNTPTSNQLLVQSKQSLSTLLGKREDTFIIAIAIDFVGDINLARNNLSLFLQGISSDSSSVQITSKP